MPDTPDSIAACACHEPAAAPKDHEKRPSSLRGRLTRALLVAVLLIACAQALVTYRTARQDTEALFDAQTQRIAISLTGSLAAGDQAGGLASVPASA